MEKDKEQQEAGRIEEQVMEGQEKEETASEAAHRERESETEHSQSSELQAEEETKEEESPQEDEGAKDAKALIEEARIMVQESDNEIKSCMQILDEDIEALEETKSKLLESSTEETKNLLEEVGFEPGDIEDIGEEGLDFEVAEAVEPMQVHDLSSGKFGAFILALIAGLAVVAGWVYAAAEKLGMALDVTKVPSQEVQNKILSWIGGGMTGGAGDPMFGMVILGGSALIVMWIVYKIKVYMRAQSNLHIAQEVKEEAKFYCTKKEECKKEMDKVSAHIHEVIKALHTFKVFFDEQNAKLRRILYVEGKRPFGEYHLKSKEEIKHTNLLLNSLNELISTPMANGSGSVSEEARAELQKVERTLERFKERLYE